MAFLPSGVSAALLSLVSPANLQTLSFSQVQGVIVQGVSAQTDTTLFTRGYTCFAFVPGNRSPLGLFQKLIELVHLLQRSTGSLGYQFFGGMQPTPLQISHI